MKKKQGARLPAPLEKDVQKQLVEYLTLIGWLVIRVNSGGMHVGGRYVPFNSARGCADLLVCARPSGRWVAVEVKREGGTATEKQEAFLADVRRAGGAAICADSLDSLRAQLRSAGFDVP